MVESELRKAGLRATLARVRILGLLENADQAHLTAEDIYKALLDEGEDVGLATVYRVLAQFEQAGLVRKLFFNSKKAAYQLTGLGEHDHLVCLKCGKIQEFIDEFAVQRRQQIETRFGFRVEGHELVVQGYCADCKNSG